MVRVGRFLRQVLPCALIACLALAALPTQALATDDGWVLMGRIAGKNRYETMKWIVNDAFVNNPGCAVVATGEGFADALCASALAGARKCSVILTSKGSLPADTIDALQRVRVHTVYIVGGESAVSGKVESELRKLGIDVTRFAGSDRYATSAVVAREVRKVAGSKSVAVVTGATFADALSLGPWCFATASPVLCVPKGGKLSGEALKEATGGGYTSAVIAGGKSAVSSEVESQLKGMSVERLAGANRYETSANVAEWACSHGLGWSRVAYATGRNYPDALAGAAAQGLKGGPLLLVDSASDVTVTLAKRYAKSIDYIYVLGGMGAVSDATAVAIRNATASAGKGDAADTLIRGAHEETVKANWGPTLTCGVGQDGTYASSDDTTYFISVKDAFGKYVDLHSSKEKMTAPVLLQYLHIIMDKKGSNPNYDGNDILANLERENAMDGIHSYGLRELEAVSVSGVKARVYECDTETLLDGGSTGYITNYVAVLETANNRVGVRLCVIYEFRSDQQALGGVCANLFRDYVSDMVLKGI